MGKFQLSIKKSDGNVDGRKMDEISDTVCTAFVVHFTRFGGLHTILVKNGSSSSGPLVITVL